MTIEPRRRKLGKGKRACSLTAGLRGNPSMFDGKKLSLVGLDIHFIDELSPKITEAVKTIYLSNNYLANLNNLDQFVNTEAASIMNNSIRYLDELQSLSRLKKLKALSLQGNVVTRMPFYREHVVNLCPALTLLDDEKISPEYRRQCQLKATNISEYFNHLRLNELRNGVLVHICKMMECHAEIRSKFGKDSCYSHSLKAHFKEVEQLGSGGAGKALQVLLQGGVFCWLQRMDCRHFNRLVQDNLYKLLVEFMRQNKGTALQGAELSELWQALGKVYRDDQFDFYSQIIAFCALLQQQSRRRGGGGLTGTVAAAEEEEEQSRDRDCADHCLSRLQFLASPCPLHCQLSHSADRWKPSMEQQLQWRQEQYHEAAHYRQQQLQQHQPVGSEKADMYSPPPSPPRYPPATSLAPSHPYAHAHSSSSSSGAGSNINGSTLKGSQHAPIVQRITKAQPNSDTYCQLSRGQGAARHTVHFADADAAGGATQDQHQRQRTAAYSRLLQEKESEQQRELEQLLQGSGVVQRSRSESLDDLTGQAEQHLKKTSHSEHVSERYEQLLQQHQHQQQHQSRNKQQQQQVVGQVVATAVGRTGSGTMSSGFESVGRPLPPRHEKPIFSATFQSSASELGNKNNEGSLRSANHAEYKHRPVNHNVAASASEPLTAENISRSLDEYKSPLSEDQEQGHDALRGHHLESVEFSAEVVAFIERALQQQQQTAEQENVGADANSSSEPQDPSSSAGSKELEARWLLASEAVRTHLTTSTQAQDLQKLRTNVQADMARTAALKAELAELSSSNSMEVLRGHINKTFDRLNLMERSNLIAHAQYRSLLASLGTFREQALAVSDAAVLHLSVQAEEVRAVQKDARFGAACLQVHQQSMGRIEELQESIARQREQEQQVLAAEKNLLELLAGQAEVGKKLHAELTQASLSLAAVDQEKRSDPAVLALAKADRAAQLVASFYPSSLACTTLKRRLFHLLRVRTTRQRRIKQFHASLLQRVNMALKKAIVAAWATVVYTAKRGMRLQRWKEKDVKRRVFYAWTDRFHLEARIAPAVANMVTKRMLQRAFFALKSAMWQRREESTKDDRHSMYVTLFCSIRIFRAWKKLTRASADRTRHCLAQAQLRSLQRLFCAWQDAASCGREEIVSIASLVVRRSEERCAAKALRAWSYLFQYRSYLCVYRRKKRAMALLLRRVQCVQGQKRLQNMAGVVAASPQGLMGNKLLVAWKRWHLRAARAKYFRHVENVLRRRGLAAAQYGVWCAWRAVLKHRRVAHRKLTALVGRSKDRILQQVFGVWKVAAALRKARVPHLRHQWLHLFDERQTVRSVKAGTIPLPLEATREVVPPPTTQYVVGNNNNNKLRQSLSNLEFQLLYWDDDDDDDEELDAHAGHGDAEDLDRVDKKSKCGGTKEKTERADDYSVLVRRYLVRWWERARGRSTLRSGFDRVQRLGKGRVRRRCFAAMLALYGRALMSHRNECRQFMMLQKEGTGVEDSHTAGGLLSVDPSIITRRAEIENLEQSALREREDLRQLADSLTLELTAREQELEQGRGAVLDLVSSIAALRAEQNGLDRRVRQAKDYVQAVATRREEFADEAKQRAEQANHLPSLLARLTSTTVSSDGGNSAGGVMTESQDGALSVVSCTCSADERLLLMQDVEALYREAVTTQEAMLRKKQHLENQREAAQTLLDQRRLLAQELDGQIAALGAERGRAEEALRACQVSLEGAFAHVAEQTSGHEALLTSLQREEEGLQNRLAVLAQQERSLADKVEALHAQREHRGLRTAATAAAHRLGKSETLLAEHLSRISGSTSASVKTSNAILAQAPHKLPQRSHVHVPISDVSIQAAVSDALHKDRLLSAAAAEGRRRALLLGSRAGTGKENACIGVHDAQSSSHRGAVAAAKATPTAAATAMHTKAKSVGRDNSCTNASSLIKKAPSPTIAAAGAGASKNSEDTAAKASHTTSQEDVDRQIEALSLRIRQRLTNI